MTKAIIGIDIGTTTLKMILFDQTGKSLYTDQEEVPIYYPSRFCVEQDPEAWWLILKKLTHKLKMQKQISNLEILAIGVSSQAPVFIPIDRKGVPLDRAMIWMDRRANELTLTRGGKVCRGIRTERYTYVRDLTGPWLLYE
jgi:xylulokinase